ncbi:VOC family protein [Streptomyces sp. NRRL S-87]|uniref:VOC family protein n=1 Tax=Streptomyces sp. NRRL S-87 TaxID=1463920 RepID=UPI0034E2745C
MPEALGIGHLVLTVTDVKRSAEFYNQLLDTQTVVDVEDDFGPFAAIASPPSSSVSVRTRRRTGRTPSIRRGSGWTTAPSTSPTGPLWRRGRRGWTKGTSRIPASSRIRPGPCTSTSRTRTTSRWSSTAPPPRADRAGQTGSGQVRRSDSVTLAPRARPPRLAAR